MTVLAALLALALPAAAQQSHNDALSKLDPLLCAAKDAKLKGRTEFFDAKGLPLLSLKDGAAEDAIVIVLGKKADLLREIAGKPCPEGKEYNAAKLRQLGQGYAIEEFIAFDGPASRRPIPHQAPGGFTVYSEMRVNLYRGKDGLVHTGRERIYSDHGTIVSEDDPNAGGVGYEDQPSAKQVSHLHTHPNSDMHFPNGIARHHPSDADVSHSNANGYFDVVVTPKFVFFINNPNAEPMVFDRKNPFGDNAVKAYVAKAAEADQYYARNKKFPPWFNEQLNKSNPWAQ